MPGSVVYQSSILNMVAAMSQAAPGKAIPKKEERKAVVKPAAPKQNPAEDRELTEEEQHAERLKAEEKRLASLVHKPYQYAKDCCFACNSLLHHREDCDHNTCRHCSGFLPGPERKPKNLHKLNKLNCWCRKGRHTEDQCPHRTCGSCNKVRPSHKEWECPLAGCVTCGKNKKDLDHELGWINCPERKCRHCKKEQVDHEEYDCPRKDSKKKCHYCGEMGHTQWKCPQWDEDHEEQN